MTLSAGQFIGLSLIISMLCVLPGAAQTRPGDSKPKDEKAAQGGESMRPWTILVYGAADNNADGPILHFLDGVRKAIDDDPGLDLLLLIDRSEKYSKDARILGEDFTGTRLYRLRKDSAERLAGGKEFPEITLDTDVELDTADATQLRKFIAWGKTQSPARRYAVMIYSHANGEDMCPDEKSRTNMGIAELTDELGVSEHVDVLALELCNMGGIEVAYQWRPGKGRFGADYLIAIPNAGPPLDWDRAFARIRSVGHDSPASQPPLDPAAMTAEEFGKLVVEEGYLGRLEHARGTDGARESAACYDLRLAADVKKAVDAMSVALAKADAREAVLELRKPDERGALMNYSGDGPYVDLYDLCQRLASHERLPSEAREAASRAAEAVDRFVIASFGMQAYAGFEKGRHGVFIAMPDAKPGRWKQFAWYTPLAGSGGAYGRWAFLRDGATAGNGEIENWFELLDTWFDEGSESGGLNGYRP